MRDIKVTKDFINSENTSVLYESGNTKVLITVSIADKVPRWLENSDKGWLTACLLYTSPSPRDPT